LDDWFEHLEARCNYSIPLHIADPDASSFAVFERQEWDESPDEKKEKQRFKRHVYVMPRECSKCTPSRPKAPPPPLNPPPSTDKPSSNPTTSTGALDVPPSNDESPSNNPPPTDESLSNPPPSTDDSPSNDPPSTDEPPSIVPPASNELLLSPAPPTNGPALSCGESNPELTLEMINSYGPNQRCIHFMFSFFYPCSSLAVGYLRNTKDTPFGQANLTHEQLHDETQKGDLGGVILNQLGGERPGIRMIERHAAADCLTKPTPKVPTGTSSLVLGLDTTHTST
jgi:hypothetical protein